MSSLINCSKCGTLFLRKNRDICEKCYKDQLVLITEIIEYVTSSPLDKIHLKTIVEHFKITMNEFEQFLTSCKLAPVEKKLIFNCIKCNSITPVESSSSFSFVCKKCIQEMKQDAIKRLSS